MNRINKFVTVLLIFSMLTMMVLPPFAQEKQTEETIFCQKCGAKNPVSARFCSKCGTKLPEQLIRPEPKKEEIPMPVDQTPPVLSDLTIGPVLEGEPLLITVKVKDESEIDRVDITYMVGEEEQYGRNSMESREDDIYEFLIPKARRPWIQYTVAAWDRAGNSKVLEGESGGPKIVEVMRKKKSRLLLWLGMIGLIGGSTVVYLQYGREEKYPVSRKLMDPPPMPSN